MRGADRWCELVRGEDEASSVSIFQRLYFTFLGLARLDTMGDQLGYQDIIMNVDTSLAASAHVSRANTLLSCPLETFNGSSHQSAEPYFVVRAACRRLLLKRYGWIIYLDKLEGTSSQRVGLTFVMISRQGVPLARPASES